MLGSCLLYFTSMSTTDSHDTTRLPQETDLDARLTPHSRVVRNPRLHSRLGTSQDGDPLTPPPHSAPPMQAVSPMVYKPNVNLEDAVKWPIDLPGKLDFRNMDVFEGNSQ